MKILALHGFLGQGSDWQLLQSQVDADWTCPSLFHPETNIRMNDFSEATRTLMEELAESSFDLLIGYSFGGRLALELFKRYPGLCGKMLLLSTHLGGLQTAELNAKRKKDSDWAIRFLSEDWDSLMSAWNDQPLFANDLKAPRVATDYDRRKLYMALENLSLADQAMYLDLDENLREKLVFAVGRDDEKFLQLYHNYKQSQWISDFQILPGGHRLHQPPSEPLVDLLAGLVNTAKM